ncbi:15472_t:CDS:2 [Gigaspora rosea]|nr:15472_t:CDS:2 [Gigaspora rosea]
MPVLAYLNFSKTFILFTDASDLALGAILSQKDEKGNEKGIFDPTYIEIDSFYIQIIRP